MDLAGNVVNATLRGLPYAGQDTTPVTDVALGELVVPDVTFTQAHRIDFGDARPRRRARTSRTRQVLFLFECFGEVPAPPASRTRPTTTSRPRPKCGGSAVLKRMTKMIWDSGRRASTPGRDATAKYIEQWLKSPLVLGPSGAMLTWR